MSQQYPGQPPGGGMPPGYGGGPGLPQAPYPPQGIPGQQAPGQIPAPRSNRTLLWVGIGCGGLMLLGLAAVVGGVLWFKVRTNATIEDLQRLQASASAAPILPVPPLGSTGGTRVLGELTGDCKMAYGCCRAIAAKSTASAAAAEACELFKTAGYPEATCALALTGYRKAAELAGVRCE